MLCFAKFVRFEAELQCLSFNMGQVVIRSKESLIVRYRTRSNIYM